MVSRWHGERGRRRGAAGPPVQAEDDEEEVLRAARGDARELCAPGVLRDREEVPRGSQPAQGAAAEELLQHHSEAGLETEARDSAVHQGGAAVHRGW